VTGFDLLDKRELTVIGVELATADLNELAAVAADVLSLDRADVLVTDYLDHVLTFDVLCTTVYPHQLLDRASALLEALAGVAGVTLMPDARVDARGMLGWIAADAVGMAAAMNVAMSRADDVTDMLRRRVAMLSTGSEVVERRIVDTNAASIAERLGRAGYLCEHRGAVRDDIELIAGAIRQTVTRGFGLVVVTGGVGAEAKDCTVEAIQRLDPDAATPYLAHFEQGHGRHVKDGVRIAVATYDGTRLVALPGPNDEVTVALQALVDGLDAKLDNAALAESIAVVLRAKLRQQHQHSPGHDHGHDHGHDQPAPAIRRITRELLHDLHGMRRGYVVAAEPGIVAGMALLDASAAPDPAGQWVPLRADGDVVEAGDRLIEVTGTAWELAVAEDHALGILGFAGGIARHARQLRTAAPPGLRVVCGGWKKLPSALKPALRAGLDVAGIGHRLLDDEFVYVDKNVVAQLGDVSAAVTAGLALQHGPVAVQVIDVAGARAAVQAGCGVVMVDNGDLASLHHIAAALRSDGSRVTLAFAGGVCLDDLTEAAAAGATIVDVGRAVLDAPLWDLRFVVEPRPSR
jgi:nicotinate-nucleotide pyrophosphorylase (carboxylating)